MSDTAHDYQTITPASTEGMEQLFEAVQDGVQGQLTEVQHTVSVGLLDVQDSVPETVTVVEAANLLNIDRRSIVRLINWNKLKASKDARGKWLVDKQSVLDRLSTQDSVLDKSLPEVQETVLLENVEAQDTVSDGVSPVMEAIYGKNSSVQDIVQPALLQIVEQQSQQLQQAYTYLDAATARVLYLQQQLEEKENEIKLLTDSQHKTGWWARFSSWFFKSR